MEADARLVCVGMPVFNGERHLRKALDSLLSQDHKNLELVVTDNNSTDRTPAICEEYMARDRRVRYFRTARNYGPIANFRNALALCHASHFMWASHDDWWEEGFVSHLLGILLANAEVALAACEARYCLDNGIDLPAFPEGAFWHERGLSLSRGRDRLLAVLEHSYGNLIYGMYRIDALKDQSGSTVMDVYKGTRTMNEIPVFLQVASRGKIYVSDRVLFHKRTNWRTYCQAAAEYGIDVAPAQPSISLSSSGASYGALVRSPQKALRRTTLERIIRALTADLEYHFQSLKDILRATLALEEPGLLKTELAARTAGHLGCHMVRLQLIRLRLLGRSPGPPEDKGLAL